MKTAYLYDDIYLNHETGWDHPECPERLLAVNKRISSAPFYKELLLVSPEEPAIEIIEAIHVPSYIQRIQREIESGAPYIDTMDTAVSRDSYKAALMAVGGAVAVCDLIGAGTVKNAFCAIRPPGHHAEKDYAEGFCLFNNIAIAAAYLKKTFLYEKIAIIDWDVHHGNGTQHSFYEDDSVYYMSLHQFPHFPGTGAIHERGTGKGEGFTLNLPMSPGDGDSQYLNTFHSRILPELESFKPDIILVSAGYDAHRADPLSSINLTTGCFYEMTSLLMEAADKFCNGRLIAFLEGGYNLDALANSVDKTMQALLGLKLS